MWLTPDDAVGPAPVTQLPEAVVPGFGPGHRQGRRARNVRRTLAATDPDLLQRVPAAIEDGDTVNPQVIPTPRPTEQIDPTAGGIEGEARPGQQPIAGWDGEPGASAPDATRPTIW